MPEPEQTISELTTEDQNRLTQQRAVIEAYLANDDARQKYETSAGKLGLLRALLEQNVFKANQTYELQSMGIVLGDVFVQELGMHWVIVEDDHGRDPALHLANTSIFLFPLTMISKCMERGEVVDVFQLFNGIAAKIDELRETADQTTGGRIG